MTRCAGLPGGEGGAEVTRREKSSPFSGFPVVLTLSVVLIQLLWFCEDVHSLKTVVGEGQMIFFCSRSVISGTTAAVATGGGKAVWPVPQWQGLLAVNPDGFSLQPALHGTSLLVLPPATGLPGSFGQLLDSTLPEQGMGRRKVSGQPEPNR